MMKILVVGQSGQLARSLQEVSKPDDWQVICVGRPDIELSDVDSIQRQLDHFSPNIVINAAAYTAVDRAEEEEKTANILNRDGPACLAKNCQRLDIPLIHISTDYVFDGSKSAPYLESDPVAPLGVYGRSKLAGEEAVRNILGKHLILRTAWVYSPFGSNFAKTMLRLAQDRDELKIIDDQHGSPSYAPHLAQAIISMVARLNNEQGSDQLWGTYHMTGSGETTWYAFAHEIFSDSKDLGGPSAGVFPIPTREYPTPAQRPANSVLDCGRLAEQFNIRLPDWRDGVSECVERLLKERKS